MLGLDAAGKTSMFLSPLYPTVILSASGAFWSLIRIIGKGRAYLSETGREYVELE